MRALLALGSVLSFAYGALAITWMRTDAHLIVIVICMLGGGMLGGMVEILTLQRRILSKVEQDNRGA